MTNYIADQNRFSLPEPSEAALKSIYDFDAQLVVVPSRRKPIYMLCRRRLHSAGFGKLVMMDNRNPDVAMLYDHGLIDVAPLTPLATMWSAGWVSQLLQELKARDIWAAGGAEKFIQIVEDAEAAAEIRKHKALHSDFEHRARDAWRSLQARTGQRNQRASGFLPSRSTH